jgi:AcrR family transcriptional regulator
VTTAARLPAAERRRELVETAIRLFSEGSYRGTTTAEIAHAAGVSEPILYRHFASKRDLYLAALDHVWEQAREAWEEVLTASADVSETYEKLGRRHLAVRDCKFLLAELWAQALTESADDAELRKHLRRHMREVHGFVADAIRRLQEKGGIARDRDAEAEAWMFLAGGLLGMIGRRVGLLTDDDLARIRSARLAWLKSDA